MFMILQFIVFVCTCTCFIYLVVLFVVYLFFVYLSSIVLLFFVFFFKQKTAYEMPISDWSSDVCSSDLERIAVDEIDQPQACREAVSRCAVNLGDDAVAVNQAAQAGAWFDDLGLADLPCAFERWQRPICELQIGNDALRIDGIGRERRAPGLEIAAVVIEREHALAHAGQADQRQRLCIVANHALQAMFVAAVGDMQNLFGLQRSAETGRRQQRQWW